MILRRIYDAHLAQASYLVGGDATREAVVIDPSCDIDRYLAIAAAENLRITAVAETHVHADFVSGVCGFARHQRVRAYISAEGPEPAWVAEARGAGAGLATRSRSARSSSACGTRLGTRARA